jgi:hypothetical protein
VQGYPWRRSLASKRLEEQNPFWEAIQEELTVVAEPERGHSEQKKKTLLEMSVDGNPKNVELISEIQG